MVEHLLRRLFNHAQIVHVDGFLFMDHWKHEAFNESEYAVDHIVAYAERFGKLPPFFVVDTKYGTRRNRADLEDLRVRLSFKPLGSEGERTGEKSLVPEEAEGEESDRGGVWEWERALRVRASAVQERRNVGSVGSGEPPGDEPEDGIEESLRKESGWGRD